MSAWAAMLLPWAAVALAVAGLAGRGWWRRKAATVWVVMCPEIRAPALVLLVPGWRVRVAECSCGRKSAARCGKGCLHAVERYRVEAAAAALGPAGWPGRSGPLSKG